MGNSPKKLIVGCAATGAKFTPRNHHRTGDDIYNAIMGGKNIPVTVEEIVADAKAAYAEGARYFHIHARNPATREQFTDLDWYKECSLSIQKHCPGMVLSFGASRNGHEVREAIAKESEWVRIHQADIPIHQGGAHFTTLSAVAELVIIQDLKKNGHIFFGSHNADFTKPLKDIKLSSDVEELSVETNSTLGAARYGSTSPKIQFETLKRAITARNTHGLPHEIEWGQYLSNLALTKYTIEHPDLRIGQPLGSLNIVLLFGFSPKLPFPHTYGEFKRVVDSAKKLGLDSATGEKNIDITITVGAAVMPKCMAEHHISSDIGGDQRRMQPLERIAIYAAQPDSNVDILRAGMEDSPCLIDPSGSLALTDNKTLVSIAASTAREYGANIITSPFAVADMLRLPKNPAASYQRRDAHLRYEG